MEQKHFCQSCGMPLEDSQYKGTEKDGSLSEDFCSYCYKDGAYVADCTMDEMIEHCLQYLDDFNVDSPEKLTVDQARAQMREYFPHLKRWSGQ